MITKKFDSSRGEVDKYTAVIGDDGRLGCDCRGWTIFKNRPRLCGHLKEWTDELGLSRTERGDYVYVDVATPRTFGRSGKAVLTASLGNFAGTAQSRARAKAKDESAELARAAETKAYGRAEAHASPAPVKPVSPMLASTMDNARVTDWTEWAAEEKFDGHRAVVMVSAAEVSAWSRSGKTRELPPQVVADFATMPNGIYDGELMGREGGTFADVRRLTTQDEAYFVAFDVVNYLGDDVKGSTYDERRALLADAFASASPMASVRMAKSVHIKCEADIVRLAEKIWNRGGEGLILKRRGARYQAGKRSPDFVKVKRGGTEVCTVIGFVAGENGPFSVVALRGDESGIETTVKTKNNAELKAFGAATPRETPFDAFKVDDPWHPAIGRKLRIEFTSRDDAAFTNPRWDRWENE